MTPQAKQRALGLLHIEIENLRQHGFRSLLCLGTGLAAPVDCCDDCPLIDFVPSACRGTLSPCRHIPLNQRGETVEILMQKPDHAYLEGQLLQWMERTADQLLQELEGESSARP